MDLADLLRAIERRWYVVVVGLFVTVGIGYWALSAATPAYSARGLVLLLPPAQLADETGSGNPFLAMGPLELTSDIVVVYLQSSAMNNEVLAQAPDAKYSAMIEPSTRGPLIAIDVTNTTPEGTLATLQYIANAIPFNLERMQAEVGAPAPSQIDSIPLTMDATATKDSKGAARVLIALTVVGIAGTIMLTIAVDSILQGRRKRRRESPPPSRESSDTAESDEDLYADLAAH